MNRETQIDPLIPDHVCFERPDGSRMNYPNLGYKVEEFLRAYRGCDFRLQSHFYKELDYLDEDFNLRYGVWLTSLELSSEEGQIDEDFADRILKLYAPKTVPLGEGYRTTFADGKTVDHPKPIDWVADTLWSLEAFRNRCLSK